MSGDSIYILKNELFNGLKIGFTNNINVRLSSLNTAVPSNYEVVRVFNVESGAYAEKFVHKELDRYRVNREFFDLSPEAAVKEVSRALEKFNTYKIESMKTQKKEIKSPAHMVDFLRKQRKRVGVSQQELATLCDLSLNGISKMESRKTSVKLSTVFKMAEVIGVRLYVSYEVE